MHHGGAGKLFLFATLLALALAASGATLTPPDSCGPTPLSGNLNYNQSLAGGGCVFGDKTFNNFTSSVPNGVVVNFTQSGNTYTITFFGNLSHSFSVDYDVAVTSGPNSITEVGAGILLPNAMSTSSLTKTVTAPGGPYV